MTDLYLIRHAQTAGNADHRFQGRLDQPVSEQGRQQIEELAQYMKEIPLRAVYTSPLQRAMLTAQGIAEPHGLEPVVEEGLVEIDGGPFEGEKFTDLLVKFPVEFRTFLDEPHNFMGINGSESMRQVFDRMRDAVLKLVARHPGEAIAAVSHGATTHCFLKFARGYDLTDQVKLGWNGHAAVSRISFDDELRPTVVFVGDDSHLTLKTKPAKL